MLRAFSSSLPCCVAFLLNSITSRSLNVTNIESTKTAGRTLWKQIHYPIDTKIEYKLEAAHPDLPIFIIENVYGGLFTNPDHGMGTEVGRITTSLFAIACLRAQQGAGSQLAGHISGLRKAWEDGSWRLEPHAGTEDAIRWLVSDEGCIWVLRTIDQLVRALGENYGSTFAPMRSKV
jgi:hypothetical protein